MDEKLQAGYLPVLGFLRMQEMEKLGKSLQQGSNRTMGGVDIQQTLDNLTADWSKLDRMWTSRKQHLEEGLELQRLNQEGDRIEAALSGHEARLRVRDVGVRRLHSHLSVHLKEKADFS